MADCRELIEQWTSCLGPASVSAPEDGFPIEDVPVRVIAAPDGLDALRTAIRLAVQARCPVYPIGGRTQLHIGLPGQREGAGIDTANLNRVIDYPSRDMTITVEAGLALGRLREILSAEGQRLPVDVPRADKATIGGAVATNSAGPRRYGFGTLRDYVLGISIVDAAANQTRSGGQVVKNVAGYDLCKLYTASFGTLGIISRVTLKLKPLAESTAFACVAVQDASRLASTLDRLASTGTRPVAIEVLNPKAVECIAAKFGQPLPQGPWTVLVGFEENTRAVAWQVERLRTELQDLQSSFDSFWDQNAALLAAELTELQVREPDRVTFKANLRSSAVADFLERAHTQPLNWLLHSHAGNGIVYGHTEQAADLETFERCLNELRSLAVSMRGNLVLRRCPSQWKSRLKVWGEPRSDYWLMHTIKHKLDPENLFNPGRFVPA